MAAVRAPGGASRARTFTTCTSGAAPGRGDRDRQQQARERPADPPSCGRSRDRGGASCGSSVDCTVRASPVCGVDARAQPRFALTGTRARPSNLARPPDQSVPTRLASSRPKRRNPNEACLAHPVDARVRRRARRGRRRGRPARSRCTAPCSSTTTTPSPGRWCKFEELVEEVLRQADQLRAAQEQRARPGEGLLRVHEPGQGGRLRHRVAGAHVDLLARRRRSSTRRSCSATSTTGTRCSTPTC